jgi:sugar phosphate isomerase/epimerase
MEQLLPYICEIHIKDGVDNGPAVLLGEGNSGFRQAMAVLREKTYKGWLIIENNYLTMSHNYQLTDAQTHRNC